MVYDHPIHQVHECFGWWKSNMLVICYLKGHNRKCQHKDCKVTGQNNGPNLWKRKLQ